MFKRGQITIFIILGIVILIAVVFGVVMRKEIVKAVSSSEDKQAISFSEQSAEVKKHVVGCLEESLRDAVFNSRIGSMPSIASNEDYYAQIAMLVKDKTDACINNFEQFNGLTITRGEISGLKVYGNSVVPYPTKIQADLKMNVNIAKGEESAAYSEFSSYIPLKARAVVAQ
jgi:hypothetical protein